jgi:hypothetical protein
MEWRSDGVLECWSGGVVEWWSVGVLECWRSDRRGSAVLLGTAVLSYWIANTDHCLLLTCTRRRHVLEPRRGMPVRIATRSVAGAATPIPCGWWPLCSSPSPHQFSLD